MLQEMIVLRKHCCYGRHWTQKKVGCRRHRAEQAWYPGDAMLWRQQCPGDSNVSGESDVRRLWHLSGVQETVGFSMQWWSEVGGVWSSGSPGSGGVQETVGLRG